MTQIQKDYQRGFVLEPTKLSRIVDTIHERFADHENATQVDRFEVFLRGDRREEMTRLDDVLALDNSRRHRIERLLISCSAFTLVTTNPQHEVQVDFASPRISKTTVPESITKVVSISVRSDARDWASSTLSRVEEQVERTWLRQARPLGILVGLLVAVVMVLASEFLTIRATRSDYAMWLTHSDLDRLEATLRQQGGSLTDENVREIAAMQLQNILADRRLEQPPRIEPRRALVVGLPLLVVLGCVITLLTTCYPREVFHWGDEVERYANTLQLRRVIWGVLVAAMVGVLSRFLFEGVNSWLPPQQ